MPIAWLARERRYVEKLATPDVTIADLIGDIDPIKAARAGRELGDELVMHYGLLPRANRGLFAINELPDLASKVQVGLFNILQEGDVQIKGFPVRLRLDVALVFTRQPGGLHRAGQDHHAAQGPHRLRDPHALRAHRATKRWRSPRRKRGWTARDGAAHAAARAGARLRPRDHRGGGVPGARRSESGSAIRRQPAAADHRARKRRVERRAARRSTTAKPRRCRASATSTRRCPSLTGKIELEYEGELKGAEHVARELVRAAVATVFDGRAVGDRHPPDRSTWFENGGTLDLSDTSSADAAARAVGDIDGFDEALPALGAQRSRSGAACARRSPTSSSKACARCGRSAAPKAASCSRRRRRPRAARAQPRTRGDSNELMEEDDETAGEAAKKKYYN